MTTKISASADGAYGSLSVGANEVMRFGSDNSGQLASFRNKLINGDMRIAQRGTVALTTNDYVYGGCDRFYSLVSALTGLTANVSQLGYRQNIYIATSSGSGAIYSGQRIESANSASLSGKKVTVSANVSHDYGSPVQIVITLNKPTAKDNFASIVGIANSGNIPADNLATIRVSYTFTLGATDADNGLDVNIGFTGLSAPAGKTFQVWNVQLEEGSIATPFEQRPIGLELSLCQRYYEIGQQDHSYMAGLSGITAAYGSIGFMVRKRVIPTIAGSGFQYYSAGNPTAFTPTFPSAFTDRLRYQAVTAVNWNGWVGAGNWTASAEL